MGWSDRQATDVARRVRAKVGLGWNYLGRPVQEALAEAEVLHVVTSQDNPTVQVPDVESLRDRVFGLLFPERE